jgi:hypothetical protein
MTPDNPQIEVSMNSPGSPRQTMAATETQERGMSASEQPVHENPSLGVRKARRIIVAASVVTLLAGAGIVVIVTNGGNSQKPHTAASASPSVAVSQPTSEDQAAVAAEARYREFLRVRDDIGHAGYRSASAFDTVAVSPERTVQEISVRKARGLREVGTTGVVSIKVLSVDLTPTAGNYPAVVLQACIDVSGVDVLDGHGKSVVSPTRVPRSQSTVTMYQYAKGTKGAAAGGWFVFEATSKAEPC